MLFNIHDAVKIRTHYFNILIGTKLGNGADLKIDGLFICHKGNIQKAIQSLIDNNFDDKYPLIGVTNENEKVFEIYVYAYDGANVFYHELDKNLSEKSIAKIYPIA